MRVNQSIPLCVDCDGSLIATDLLHEAIFVLLKQSLFDFIFIPFWLLHGKAYLKARIAERVEFNWASLPYRPEVLALIRDAKIQGRSVVLATASPKKWAVGIANHLQIFDMVMATQDGVNLAGPHKAKALVDQFGEAGFDYIGDSKADISVWEHSHGAIVVAKNDHMKKVVGDRFNLIKIITPPKATLPTYVKALRVHQWLKNALIYAPLLAAHKITDMQMLLTATFAFIAFSACASSVYILNDLLDLESDRLHIRKRKRPFTAGTIPISVGGLLIPVLLGLSLLVSVTFLPLNFLYVLVSYFVMTLAYSIRLKRQVIVDVIMLGGLYTIRILAGAAATAINLSFWLLAFSMFIFLSLALVKRYSELWVTLQQNKMEAAGRGYSVADLPVLMAIGVSSGMISVMVFSLYINLPDTSAMYPRKPWLWAIPPTLLYWNSRVWMKAHRGEVDDDPIVFAIKDWQTLIILALSAGLFLVASV